ncbi:uncharacterized protein LOC144454372 [Phascolarctos cinereus]
MSWGWESQRLPALPRRRGWEGMGFPFLLRPARGWGAVWSLEGDGETVVGSSRSPSYTARAMATLPPPSPLPVGDGDDDSAGARRPGPPPPPPPPPPPRPTEAAASAAATAPGGGGGAHGWLALPLSSPGRRRRGPYLGPPRLGPWRACGSGMAATAELSRRYLLMCTPQNALTWPHNQEGDPVFTL